MVAQHDVDTFRDQLSTVIRELAKDERMLSALARSVVEGAERETTRAMAEYETAEHPGADLHAIGRILKRATEEQAAFHEQLNEAHAYLRSLDERLRSLSGELTHDFETIETDAPANVTQVGTRIVREFKTIASKEEPGLDREDRDLERLMRRVNALTRMMIEHDFTRAHESDRIRDRPREAHLKRFKELQRRIRRVAELLKRNALAALEHIETLRHELEAELANVEDFERSFRRAA